MVDILLDAAAMGMNIVEREGISFSHPSRFILVGTMNPEEGDLRPQLLDRFALSVEIHGIRDARERVQIMERNLAFEADLRRVRSPGSRRNKNSPSRSKRGASWSAGDLHQPRPALDRLADRFPAGGRPPPRPGHSESRARPGRLRRAYGDHARDIALAAELALPHRLKRSPFQQASTRMEELAERIEQLQGRAPPASAERTPPPAKTSGKKKVTDGEPGEERAAAQVEPSKQDPFDQGNRTGGRAANPPRSASPSTRAG